MIRWDSKLKKMKLDGFYKVLINERTHQKGMKQWRN